MLRDVEKGILKVGVQALGVGVDFGIDVNECVVYINYIGNFQEFI